MNKILPILCVVVLSSCSINSVHQVILPDGKQANLINCSNDDCKNKMMKSCPNGYDVLDREDRIGLIGGVNSNVYFRCK